ncbi:hypothetical protein NDU88_007410 [Pleurodeles waltl]|uniref:Rab-GAP TBC domain-containing protein n=1 Tax=Pleurodeles waltl TaxID=8319 RepID=A0AAV7PP96_PLEWA|nr:hypothetical protein NDU88_007410 [Pleurodeles waltl]
MGAVLRCWPQPTDFKADLSRSCTLVARVNLHARASCCVTALRLKISCSLATGTLRPRVHPSTSEEDEILTISGGSKIDSDSRDSVFFNKFRRPTCKLSINGYEIVVVADSGSPYTLVSEKVWREHFDHIELQKSHIRPVGYGGKPVEVLGEYEVELSFQGNLAKGVVYVAKDDACLLGSEDQKKLGILLDPNNPDQVILSKNYNRVLSVGSIWLDAFPDVFKDGIGMFKNFAHKIKLKENAVPKVHRVRRVPLALRAELKRELDRLCDQHIIEKVDASDWVAPIVIACKANGSIRMKVIKIYKNAVMLEDGNWWNKERLSLAREVELKNRTWYESTKVEQETKDIRGKHSLRGVKVLDKESVGPSKEEYEKNKYCGELPGQKQAQQLAQRPVLTVGLETACIRSFRESIENEIPSSVSSLETGSGSLETGSMETNGPAASPKWEEQQKVLAMEQLCGVFRVDLGQMRSLRLFFSDEACTSGQLVVASRESQYKVFHFHHGGLDKLSEVFQQWKYCRETQLKDHQVTDEKTCMQFSIRRPNLPSSEAHPEENMYKRLDVSVWLRHLNESGQVEEEYKLRKAIFFGGIDVSIRGEVWPFLLHYYKCESTSQEREALRVQRRSEYFEIQQKRLTMSPEQQKEFWRNVQFTVDKDVVRTDRSNPFFRGEDNPNVEAMRRILLNYAIYNPSIGYSQGMSDLVAPILTEVLDESDTFWCFVGLMQNTIFISSPRDEDMEKQLMYLRELLRLMHPQFYQHLVSLGEDGLQMLFCHRWILLCFKREFPCAEALRIWEACWAHYQTDYFHLFICVAIVWIYGDDVIEQQLATDQMLLHFGNLSMHMNGELVLRKARSLLYQFRLLPRIPCSLHDLCKLCGTGMWDSGSIPAVECSGHHPDSEDCPYGGTVEELSPKPANEVKKGQKGQKSRDAFHFMK